PREFHPEPLTDPDLNLSIHPARVTARRLPPSAEPSGSSRYSPVGPSSTAMTRPLRSTSITLASSLLRGSPPLSGASGTAGHVTIEVHARVIRFRVKRHIAGPGNRCSKPANEDTGTKADDPDKNRGSQFAQ